MRHRGRMVDREKHNPGLDGDREQQKYKREGEKGCHHSKKREKLNARA